MAFAIDTYAVFGFPIAHSLSPLIHQHFAKGLGKTIDYQKIACPEGSFTEKVLAFAAKGGKGANVTVPFKEEAHTLCDTLSQRAAAAGSVNTLSFRNGTIKGDNTDGIGLIRDLQRLDQAVDGRVLVLGAGGATRGILPFLAHAKQLWIANRTLEKAEALKASYPKATVSTFEDIEKKPFDCIIHATSLGLSGDHVSLDPSLFTGSFCYDLSYGKAAKPFLDYARKWPIKGASDGIGMLIEQAAESFYGWHDAKPHPQETLDYLMPYVNA